MSTGEITAAQIAAVATVLREIIAVKDLADYTNQRSGGAVVTEVVAITNALSKRGIARFITLARLGASFNENNDTHIEGAVDCSMYWFYRHIKASATQAEAFLQSAKGLADELRGARRSVGVLSGRIEHDADNRELGDNFKNTFRQRNAELDDEEDD